MRPMLYSSTSTMRLSANSLGAWPTAPPAAGMLRMLTSRRPDSRLTTASRLMSRVHSNSWEAAAPRMTRSEGMADSSLCAETSCTMRGGRRDSWTIQLSRTQKTAEACKQGLKNKEEQRVTL